jgi:subtilase family serine protease
VQAANTRGWSEKAWIDGGSNCSIAIKRPSFQSAISACTHRYGSDVSAVGDPNTGVAVFNKAAGGFIVVGGTSASSPFVAGVMALYGLGAKGPGFAYANATKFFDVKSGHNGTCNNLLCKAQIGYDGPTGIGTPNASKL